MKPVINKIPVFDATKGTKVTFKTDTQIYSYYIDIKNEISGQGFGKLATVIDKSKTFKHTIPANELENNNIYSISVKIKAIDSKTYTSDAQIFKCIPTPSFSLTIDDGSQEYTSMSSFLNIGVNYSDNSSEGFEEQLNEFYIDVKDEYGNEFYKSDVIYDIDSTVEVNRLNNEVTYTVIGYGTTIGGMKLETQPVTLHVDYEDCKDSSMLSAYNDKKNGCIILKSKLGGVTYDIKHSTSFNPLKLSNNNELKYKGNPIVNGDFSLLVKYKPTINNVCFLKLNNGEIKVNYRLNDSNTPYFEIVSENNKSIIITKDLDGNIFSPINEIPYYYIVNLYRKDNEIFAKIKEWR